MPAPQPWAARVLVAVALVLGLAGAPARAQGLRINEFLAANETGLRDSDGDRPDWIELLCEGPAPTDVSRCYLTDELGNLVKWRFPQSPELVLQPGELLVVFASGKNRRDDPAELHTNFGLSAGGEYLALVAPDGVTILHEYFPDYPRQRPDISYGVSGNQATLVDQSSTARWLVPTSGSLGTAWTAPGFVAGGSWGSGPLGLGFDAGEGGDELPAAASFWSLAGDFDDAVGPNDGALSGGAATFVADRDGAPGAALSLDGSQHVRLDGGSGLPAYSLPAYTVAMWVRGDPQPDRRVWSEGSTSNNTPLFTIGTQAGGSTGQVDIFIRNTNGGGPAHRLSQGIAFDGEWHHIAWVDTGGNAALYIDGALDPTDFSYAKEAMPLDVTAIGAVLRSSVCCAFQGEIDDVGVWDRALGEDEIASLYTGSAVSRYAPWIGTDVGAEMAGVSPSVYARIDFEIDDPSAFDTLSLRMRYDDGFIAYLNGVVVARRNALEGSTWNSVATVERSADDAVVPETIDLTPFVGELVAGTNVLAIHGLNRSAADSELLVAPELIASGEGSFESRYFRTPSPGAPNEGAFVDFVSDTRFTVDRGFYEAPFDVEILTDTPGATIRFTIDGSEPTPTNGQTYAEPIRIDGTTTLRAAAFREGYEPTDVDTQTYIFLDDVIRQRRPAGYPTTWAGLTADYDMDPEICTDVGSPTFQPTIKQDLQAIPTMSIVMSLDDFMGPTRGIYTHPQNRGVGWERASSVEFFTADGSRPEFQENCGVRMLGGSSARPIEGKHSFRLVFSRRTGPTKLKYRLFPDSDVEEFDTIVLRCCSTDSWHFKDGGSRYRRWDSQYLRDVFMRDTLAEMGQVSSHSTYVHLYVNGIYWGLYNPCERPDDSFNAEHHGGDKEDWDVIKDFTEVFRGNITAWNQMMSLANAGFPTIAEYQRIQGNNPDGTRNPSYPNYLDVTNLCDYMIAHLWGCAEDWPHHNWYGARNRTDTTGGYRFYVWDQEITLDFVFRDRTNVSNSGSPSFLYSRLRANEEFRTLFGDRVQRHLFHDGPLAIETAQRRYLERANEIDRAIVGESARWGDFREDVPDPSNSPAELYTRDEHWVTERDKILDDYIPESHQLALERFRAGSLYPSIDPPSFVPQHGGEIDPGFVLRLTASAGTIYYTTDGTDPRLPGGSPSPTASVYGFADVETILDEGAPARSLVPTNGALGLTWTEPGFDDGSWIAGTTGVGFERTSGYEDLLGTDLLEEMDGVNATVYVRVPFELAEDDDFDSLTLRMKYDDGYVAYLNGVEVARRNAPASPTWDSDADGSHGDAEAVLFEDVDISEHIGQLRTGVNVLAIHGMNSSATSSDALFLPALVGSRLSGQSGLRLGDTTRVLARARQDNEWSALQDAVFAVDKGLRITEIAYHPAAAADDSAFEQDEFEYIELQNTSTSTIDLAGVRFVQGIEFDFTDGAVPSLAPGEIVVLVENLAAFAERYDLGAVLVAGEYRGKLANTGERLKLVGALDETILEFEFSDAWHPETDGLGPSLVIVDPAGEKDLWGLAEGWRPSEFALGSPGFAESGNPPVGGLQLPGDANQDSNLDVSDAISLLGHLFVGSPARLPCGDGTVSHPANRTVLDLNGDNEVNLSDPVYLLAYLFQGGSPPAGGTACLLVPDCASTCTR